MRALRHSAARSLALAIPVALALAGCAETATKTDAAGGAAVAAAPAKPEAKPAPTPEVLVGLTGAQLSEALGKPGFRRRDGDAQIWRYTGAGCYLDLFLYRAAAAGSFRVDHLEIRSLAGGVADNGCLADLLEAARLPAD